MGIETSKTRQSTKTSGLFTKNSHTLWGALGDLTYRKTSSTESKPSHSLKRVAILGTYIPRQCGIATFTSDVLESVAGNGVSIEAISVEDNVGTYEYNSRVTCTLDQHNLEDYSRVADWINSREFDVLCVQHEYGIYGGDSGEYLLSLLKRVKCPVVTTLHTILIEPSVQQRIVLLAIIRHSSRIVVMSKRAVSILQTVYGVPSNKIVLIEHGIPEVGPKDSVRSKELLGFQDRTLLLTFGLLSPDKGIEDAIQALPKVVQNHPDVLYLVVGATHPHIRAREGERYRDSLCSLAQDLGVSENIQFENRFTTMAELTERLQAADIYVSPYRKREQITSGTLSYAYGCGNAVVATPFWHAEELLADGRGVLVPNQNPDALALALNGLLDDKNWLRSLQAQAYQHGLDMQWPQIGKQYIETFNTAKRTKTLAVPTVSHSVSSFAMEGR
jgi:glycosyltransferase involved in cell wall biosynthesis